MASIRHVWADDPRGASVELLRVGTGAIWLLNTLFIIDPANAYFLSFQDVALSFSPSTWGGPGLADFVATYSVFFAWLIAMVTIYLALAFLLGLTTRFACIIGVLASVGFLVTQVGTTFVVPGGTDVGPHPLYLLIYVVLFLGGAGRHFSVDRWIWASGKARLPRIARWLASPPF